MDVIVNYLSDFFYSVSGYGSDTTAYKRKHKEQHQEGVKRIDSGKEEIIMYNHPMSEGVHRLQFAIVKLNNYICFGYHYKSEFEMKCGYIKLKADSAEVIHNDHSENIPGIKAEEGVEYELIYDMNRKTMFIRCGDGLKKQILKDLPLIVTPYIIRYKGCEFGWGDYWYIPPFMIQRYEIVKTDTLLIGKNNVITMYLERGELYNNKNAYTEKIDYVMCNKVFEGDDNRYNSYVLNEVKNMIDVGMEDGIYHFYFEILSIGSEGISFGYCENLDSSYEIYPYIKLLEGLSQKIENSISTPIPNISGVVGRKYELIYDMNKKIMLIKQGNGTVELISANLPTPIYPYIIAGGSDASVRLIEYYKERNYYNLYENIELQNYDVRVVGDEVVINGMNVRIGDDVINEVIVPNTIYGIYNYKKYYMIEYLSNLIKNNSHYDIDSVKDFINSTFSLGANRNEYVYKSGSINELLVLLKYFHDNSRLLDSPDSFVEVINSLRIDQSDESKKCLEFSTSTPIFQFPKRKIYLRECYYEMFKDICKCLSINKFNRIPNIIVTGQPGIGKTSFIYVLLFFIKNLCKMEELTKEIKGIKNILNELGLKVVNKENYKIIINTMKEEIKNTYGKLKLIIEEVNKENNMEEEDDDEISSDSLHPNKEEVLKFVQNTINLMSNRINYCQLKEDEIIDEKKLINFILSCDNKNILENVYELSLRIKEKMADKNLIKRLLLLLKPKSDELKRTQEYVDKLIKNKNDYILNEKWRGIEGKLKDIYVIKGKRHGTDDEKKIYLLKDGVIFKIQIPLKDIKNSIIIVDTFNKEFNLSNRVISISSPDSDNYDKYDKSCKELYFDSLSPDEVKEWFEKCICFNKDAEFEKVCERYGNIPRQIYYHYLYNENYKKDYWDYYKKLIQRVIGCIGYKDYINKYQKKDNLLIYPLSNIILKFNLKKKMDNDLGFKILKPDKKLIYTSNSVENYINCKFFPPNSSEQLKVVMNKYNSITERYMKRMALKQIIAYELSMKEDCYYDPNFKFDSKKELSAYYPEKARNIVYFILDESNFFDLIMDGVFIKVLLEDGTLDDGKTKFNKSNYQNEINTSIKDYSKNKSGNFFYCVMKGNTLPEKYDITEIEDEEMKKKQDERKEEEERIKNKEEEEAKDFDVYVGNNNRIYLMRKCFNDMLDIICKDDFNFSYQRNYLIFGNAKIGKTVLAHILRYKIMGKAIEKGKSVEVFLKYRSKNDKSEDVDFGKDIIEPYIVIVDGISVGEDDYSDAKMIIMLADSYDEKCETFQSKRCPLVMYIPPFTIKEVKKVIKLESKNYTNITKRTFTKYKSLIDQSNDNDNCQDDNNRNINVNNDSLDTIQDDEDVCTKMLNNYEYYGGVIGYYKNTRDTIYSDMPKVNIDLISEIMKGITNSSLSMTDYERIFIYETDENDVTKSDNLRFISQTIEKMVYDEVFTIKEKDDCERKIKMLCDNPTWPIAGLLYERIIFFVMNNSNHFPSDIVDKIKKLKTEEDLGINLNNLEELKKLLDEKLN